MKATCFRCQTVGVVSDLWGKGDAHVFLCPQCSSVSLGKRQAQEERKRIKMRKFSFTSIGLLLNDACLQIAASPTLSKNKSLQKQIDTVWGWTQKMLNWCGINEVEDLGEGRKKVLIPRSIVNNYEREIVVKLNDKYFKNKEASGQFTPEQSTLAGLNAICWTLQELIHFHEKSLSQIREMRFLLQTALTLENKLYSEIGGEPAATAEEYGVDIYLETLLPTLSLRRAA